MEHKPYQYDYPRPALTVDAMIFTYNKGELKLLLIKRRDAPFKDCWAFPGGFIDEGETAEKAVKRELEEETSMQLSVMQQVYTASAIGRDPRGWTISVIFMGFLAGSEVSLHAGDDAIDAKWHLLHHLPELAFDHGEIVKEVTNILSRRLLTDHILKKLLPELSSEDELRTLLKLIYNTEYQVKDLIYRLQINGQIKVADREGYFQML